MMNINTPSKPNKVFASLFVVFSCIVMSACQHSGSYDLPAEYIPEPAGTRQNVAFSMQATKGEQFKYLLGNGSWYADSISLSPEGQNQVEWMVENLDTNPYTVFVEPSGDHDIDENRREALIEYFDLQGIEDSENFVVVSAHPFKSDRVEELESQ